MGPRAPRRLTHRPSAVKPHVTAIRRTLTAAPKSYVTDLTHFDGVLAPGSKAPAPAKKLARFLAAVVQVASREALGTVRTGVR